MEPIYLTEQEFADIKKNKQYLGSGVDGAAYKIDKHSVYKFYHKDRTYIATPNPIFDEEGVIISDFKSLRSNNRVKVNENILYTDGDGVILTREEAIYKAMEKQKNVKYTDLPQGAIYVNNKLTGCVYKYYPHKLGIYASAYLPLKQRLIICKRLIEKVDELLSSNVYPLTLAQRDEALPFRKNGSNVLIGFDLDPIIIDLDGISALYSDNYSDKYYNRVLTTLSTLIIEILSRVELADIKEDDEYVISDYLCRMIEAGIPSLLAHKYFDYNQLNMDDLSHIIKTLEKKKNS